VHIKHFYHIAIVAKVLALVSHHNGCSFLVRSLMFSSVHQHCRFHDRDCIQHVKTCNVFPHRFFSGTGGIITASD